MEYSFGNLAIFKRVVLEAKKDPMREIPPTGSFKRYVMCSKNDKFTAVYEAADDAFGPRTIVILYDRTIEGGIAREWYLRK